MNNCHIIFRSCSGVYTFHNDINRIGESITKQEIILRCLNSLVNSINLTNNNFKLKLTIVDDHSNSDCLSNIETILKKCKCDNNIVNLAETGNGNSLKECYNIAKVSDNDLIFFVEDDYLHNSNVINEMLLSYNIISSHIQKEIALFPCDYPDNYTRPELLNIPSFIALGNSCHWKTIINSTSTFLCTKKLINDNWNVFDEMTNFKLGSVNNFYKIWRSNNAFLLSPLPSLSIHLHQNTKSSFIDWKKLWNESNYRI